jgi:hypothetical protein
VTAERLARLEARIAGVDVEREKGRAAVGAGVAIAVGAAGLWALAVVILAVALGRAAARTVRRELAGAALIEFERRRDVDLRVAADR